MPERRSLDPGRRTRDKGPSHFRAMIVGGVLLLAVSEACLALLYLRSENAAKQRIYDACMLRNQQWDAVITKDRAVLANARTSAVISDVKSVYEDEIAVLTRTRVNCDDLRAGGRQ